jgi:hypothetical protein
MVELKIFSVGSCKCRKGYGRRGGTVRSYSYFLPIVGWVEWYEGLEISGGGRGRVLVKPQGLEPREPPQGASQPRQFSAVVKVRTI